MRKKSRKNSLNLYFIILLYFVCFKFNGQNKKVYTIPKEYYKLEEDSLNFFE